MARRTPSFLALGCWVLLSSMAFAQAYNSTEYVRNIYRKYLNREPTPNELTQWVWSFQKGLTLPEAQQTFLSSDEYFSRYARSNSAFITGLFTDVLDRPPSTDESLQWLHRLNVSQSDRAKIVKEFLRAAQGHTAPSTPAPRPDPVSAESQLVATASLLYGAIEEELGGTRQGRELSVMARNLVNASRSLEKAKQVSSSLYDQALTDTRIAFQAMEEEIHQLHFSARGSSTYVTKYQQILNSISPPAATTTANMAPLPATRKPAPDGISAEFYNQYLQLSATLLTDTTQVVQFLRGSVTQDASTSQLLRDVEFFQSQVESVQQATNIGMAKQELRHEVLRLRALSQGVTRAMQQSGRVGRVALRWEIVVGDLQDIGDLVGVTAGPVIDPGQPVLLNLPTYHQLPYRVQRPTAAQVSSQAIPITDQSIAYIDGFVTGFNRFLPLSPRVPALQAQARRLRVQLVQFRQELAGGATTLQLKAQLQQINQSLLAVNTLWVRTVQERQLTNTPTLTGITQSIQSLNQIFETL